jgi:hypothetical protein
MPRLLTLPLDKPLFRWRRFRQFLGWCVHFYTALGLVAAAGIAVLIVRGGGESFRAAFASRPSALSNNARYNKPLGLRERRRIDTRLTENSPVFHAGTGLFLTSKYHISDFPSQQRGEGERASFPAG